MHRFRLAAFSGVLLFSCGLSGRLVAQDADFRGTFVRDPAAGDPMKAVRDGGVKKVKNPLLRPFARGRIREATQTSSWVQINFTPEQIVINADGKIFSSPADGSPVRWERVPGDTVKFSSEWSGDMLEQKFTGRDGSRMNMYSLSPDGNILKLHVSIHSDQLSGPIEYDQVYRRHGATADSSRKRSSARPVAPS